ncbi:uncharacterized protein VTP21DRAFT_8553 [Calcarisporiella thermophila]|uniref:uncharacterized protein n=1 Tax=Calcarisporiella thermophila TaxID=911321 RepID=UPI0037440D05
MNAVILLVHFCEMHGPNVIFCTQAFHARPLDSDSDTVVDPPLSPSSQKSSGKRDEGNLRTQASRSQPAANTPCCSAVWPTVVGDPAESGNDVPTGSVTVDPDDPKVTYVSSKSPSHPQLYAAVRQACVRSLSCEFLPGREGPVLFGDDQNGYTLSYMFKIHDSQARGHVRFYSIICLMTDRIYLVSSWPFLVSKFRALSRFLQIHADRVYEKEKRAKDRQDMSSRVGPYGPMSPEQFLRRRGTLLLRSLSDLFNIKDLFVQLHANFSWILKTAGRRLRERHFDGHLTDPRENIPIHMSSCLLPSVHTPGELPHRSLSNAPASRQASDLSTCTSATLYSTTMGESTSPEMVSSLQHLWDALGAAESRKLFFNLVIGNQVVIRGANVHLVTRIVNLLRDLIPATCCSVIEYDMVYHPTWECNLLGMSEIEIPEDVERTSLVVLDVEWVEAERHESKSDCMRDSDSRLRVQLRSGLDEPGLDRPLSGAHRVQGVAHLGEADLPQMRSLKISQSLSSSAPVSSLNTSSPNLITAAVNAITTSPPRLIDDFESVFQLRLSPSLLRLRLVALRAHWLSKTRQFYRYFRSSNSESPPLREFLLALHLDERDLPVLRFWVRTFRVINSSLYLKE